MAGPTGREARSAPLFCCAVSVRESLAARRTIPVALLIESEPPPAAFWMSRIPVAPELSSTWRIRRPVLLRFDQSSDAWIM